MQCSWGSGMKAYRIKGWDKHYENNRSREIKKPEWLPLPNSFDGRGYMELCDHPAGMSHYGAWCMLLGAASRMPLRGLLVSDSGRPLSVKDLARMTRGSAKAFEEALPRLIGIGWVEEIDHVTVVKDANSAALGEDAEGQKNAELTPQGAGIPQEGAGKRPLNRNGNRNGNKKENGVAARGPASSTTPSPQRSALTMDEAMAEVEDQDRVEIVRPMPREISWLDWRQTCTQIYIARDGDDGDRANWEALFRRAGAEAMDDLYRTTTKTLPAGKRLGFRQALDWITAHYEEAKS